MPRSVVVSAGPVADAGRRRTGHGEAAIRRRSGCASPFGPGVRVEPATAKPRSAAGPSGLPAPVKPGPRGLFGVPRAWTSIAGGAGDVGSEPPAAQGKAAERIPPGRNRISPESETESHLKTVSPRA